ncbi:orotate phosphoribosyltransferase [Nanohaloarchaea archaeon H01]|nr:orotate phosphoribosyltransferase [Nanohaloarchaea archaeon H01]
MDTTKMCDYCGEKRVKETCGVCGSQVCSKCSLEHGCKVCGGGVQKFE